MALGGIGYSVYSASFLCYNHTKNQGFVIFAGTLLGICAAFLWCAQGVVMMVSETLFQFSSLRSTLQPRSHAALS